MADTLSEFEYDSSPARAGIAVIGAGRMGRGIALSFTYAGYTVSLIDSEDRSAGDFNNLVASVHDEFQTELQLLQDIDVISAQQSAAIARRLDILAKNACLERLAQADFIFEAVAEVLEIKESTYTWLNSCISDQAIVASTTSTMLPDTLANFVRKQDRFLNAHWLNPAHLMPLIEISSAEKTAEATVSAVKALLAGIGKVPVVCAASPGYIVSRIQALALNEAARLVEEGVASAEDIDNAVRTGFGIRYAILGLLEFVDWGGGDILYYGSNYLAEHIDRQRFSPPEIVLRNMENNRKGLRDGVGFYDYRDRDMNAYRRGRLTAFINLLQHLGLMPQASGNSD
ncbi:MAG: 3-hydroxybutyryl-CoA dehydrogenase [Gammaproteobacteria bacterium]